MAVGVFFNGMSPVQRYLALARQAEDRGVASIWMAEHFCHREASVCATAILTTTGRVQVVPGPISPYARHPMGIAMAAATMAELAPGRVGLQVGTGSIPAQEELGVNVAQPARTMRETVQIIRRLLTGDFVDYDGRVFQIRGAKMGFTPASPLPLYLAAIGPRMLALAGELCDAVVLTAGISTDFVRHSLAVARNAAIAAGRSPTEVRAIGFLVASVSEDRGAAYAAARSFLAFLFRNAALKPDWDMTGIKFDDEAIREALKRRDWDRATSLVAEDAVGVYSAAGTPREFGDRIEAYVNAGLDVPVILPLGTEEDQAKAIGMAVEVAGRDQL